MGEKWPVRQIFSEQLALMTPEAMRRGQPIPFNPQEAWAKLQTKAGQRVLAIDAGGDKVAATIGKNYWELRSAKGMGYWEFFLRMAALAKESNLPVGLSLAGEVEGTVLKTGPNMPIFFERLQQECGGDFSRLFVHNPLALYNDAAAGLMSAAVEIIKKYPDQKTFIYLINGGGLGGCIGKDDQIIPYEPGHVLLLLNLFGQKELCSRDQSVCLEKAGASKAGIESLWRQLTGLPLSGREISNSYCGRGGALGFLADDLYEYSAQILAHAAMGMAQCSDINLKDAVIIGHGGGFKAPDYGRKVGEILGQKVFLTHWFSNNACLSGAAIEGLLA